MRYFTELSYKGTHYCGWQKQQGDPSVQQTLEDSFSKVLRSVIEFTGCGRTDTGVHASRYFAHFDFEGEFPEGFIHRINKVLPEDISIKNIYPVENEAHARFDATERSYSYYITLVKDPFHSETRWFYPFFAKTDLGKVQEAATLLLRYKEFFPFCKSNNDLKNYACRLDRAVWSFDENNAGLTFHITANRFLRGMVRLIVGMCLNVGQGKLQMEAVEEAMEKQELLSKAESAPAKGLFLTDVKYPYLAEIKNPER